MTLRDDDGPQSYLLPTPPPRKELLLDVLTEMPSEILDIVEADNKKFRMVFVSRTPRSGIVRIRLIPEEGE